MDNVVDEDSTPKKYMLYRYSPEKRQMELAVLDGIAVVNIYAGDWLYFIDQVKIPEEDTQGSQV